ncbi:MAG TPA: phage baseplate assembly protein V [Burkholderiaceae bacterium]|nr:phage baseplate assembly protein V [Burkholderiaceae bacterium]
MTNFVEHTLERVVNRLGSTFYGKYRGIVTDVDDPENLCRIRARVDSVLDGEETGWAMPAAPFAGDGHGFVMLPAVGSGVWIEFEAGNLDLPIWSGGWWASGQRPDPQGPKLRVIVSEAGNQFIFDDDANEVKIVHSGGPEITISDSEIVMKVGGCELKIGMSDISLNNGLIKVGLAGVSLVNGAMTFGVPP